MEHRRAFVSWKLQATLPFPALPQFLTLLFNPKSCYIFFMAQGRFLPIGIQTFSDIRERNAVYADKTAFVYKLATEGKPYFLSRPRRFGKSLFLSTLEAYFLGKKELFTGLALEKLEKDWIEYPVLNISFGGNSFYKTDILKSYLDDMLSDFEKVYGFGANNCKKFHSSNMTCRHVGCQ